VTSRPIVRGAGGRDLRHRAPVLLLAAALLTGGLGLATPAAAAEPPARVAIIVGPVGEELTPVYIELAQMAATAAEERGAEVATAYSPDATAENVLAAVEGANIVVYFGHGVGSPNPYSSHPNPRVVNGWGLNGRNRFDDHRASTRDGTLTYYGEQWIAEHARPAPGWVMIYSNACYAPGAGEGFEDPADEETAAARVSAYSRAPLADLGAAAFFATDFYAGAAHLVAALLDRPDLPFGEIFASEPRFEADAITRLDHASVNDAETWLQRSAYFEGKTDYWYAFAGNPTATFGGGAAAAGIGEPVSFEVPALTTEAGFVAGKASNYGATGDWEGLATVALPLEIGGEIPDGLPRYVLVCADRCAALPVVDSCPCYVGTPGQRVANLSHEAWRQVTDQPLEEGLVQVEVFFSVETSPYGSPPSS
jgi:hypothetical protein